MEKYTYEQLLEIIAELRSDHGCPWDRAQTHESMIRCLYDECDEVVEAIKNKDDENLCEELGDVLLQVLLHAQIAKEKGRFDMSDVIDGISRKRKKNANKIIKIFLNSLTNTGKKAITEVSMLHA